jgi:hypothetical protein
MVKAGDKEEAVCLLLNLLGVKKVEDRIRMFNVFLDLFTK